MSELAFLTHVQEIAAGDAPKDAFAPHRLKGLQKLSELGFPLKSHEAFRYVSLRELYTASFQFPASKSIDPQIFASAVLPECAQSHLLFVDGHFAPALSNMSAIPQAVILSLDEALKSHGSFLQNHLARLLKEETDPFAAASLALQAGGLFFYLPPKCTLSAPVQCLHVMTGKEAHVVCPRIHLVSGARSQLKWIMSTHQQYSDAAHLLLPSMDLFLEEGAFVDLAIASDAVPSWIFETVRATLKKEANFRSVSITAGAKTVRQSYRVQLKGERSEADLNGLWMLEGNHTSHVHAIVDHLAPHTRSLQRFKGVLSGTAQSSFEGKILVRKEAQKTEAYQLNNNLLLSTGAIANSKPNLEVFADDVKASHGATVSQLDPDQMFYLNTRGIAPQNAKKLLISGFCREMIDKIPYPALVKKMQAHLETFLTRGEP